MFSLVALLCRISHQISSNKNTCSSDFFSASIFDTFVTMRADLMTNIEMLVLCVIPGYNIHTYYDTIYIPYIYLGVFNYTNQERDSGKNVMNIFLERINDKLKIKIHFLII